MIIERWGGKIRRAGERKGQRQTRGGRRQRWQGGLEYGEGGREEVKWDGNRDAQGGVQKWEGRKICIPYRKGDRYWHCR